MINSNLKPKTYKLRGFTLIEILIAIGIFGIGVVALVGYYGFTAKATTVARQTTVASNLAQDLLDQTISQDYSAITVGTGTKQNYSSNANSPYSGYEKQINVALIDSNLNSSATDVGLKKIDCIVSWQASNRVEQIQMTTIITPR